jgi:predicted transcriptional regulator
MSITTIKIHEETKLELDRLREHPSESYDEVIRKAVSIIKTATNEPKLSRWAIKQIEEARKRVAKGQYVTHEEMKRRLGL